MIRVLVIQVIACACIASVFPVLSAAEVSVDDAIGVWLFDEGKGNVAKDSSPNGNDGELIAGPKWVEGKFGGALEFDGSGTSVETESADKLNEFELGDKTDFTATAWFKTDTGTGFVMSKTRLETGLGLKSSSVTEDKSGPDCRLNLSQFVTTEARVLTTESGIMLRWFLAEQRVSAMSTSMENSRETRLTIARSKAALITRTALQSASAWVITEVVHFSTASLTRSPFSKVNWIKTISRRS